MPRFQVSGRGKKTDREWKPRIYNARNEADARSKADDDGMIADVIERLPEEPPTERQLAYAKDLGISIPTEATKSEVSDLISFKVDDDEVADSDIRGLASKFEVEFTNYTGEKELYNRIWHCLEVSRTHNRVDWFTYCLYRDIAPKHVTLISDGPDNAAIKEIASNVLSDQSVLDSIQRYNGSDLIFFGERTNRKGYLENGGSNRTIAYKRISELLRGHPALNLPPKAESQSSTGKKSASGTKKTAAPQGCMVTLTYIACSIVIVISGVVWIITRT
jgi:hypothetical protein